MFRVCDEYASAPIPKWSICFIHYRRNVFSLGGNKFSCLTADGDERSSDLIARDTRNREYGNYLK